MFVLLLVALVTALAVTLIGLEPLLYAIRPKLADKAVFVVGLVLTGTVMYAHFSGLLY